MNLARIAGGVLVRTEVKWWELELEVFNNAYDELTLALSVSIHHSPFDVRVVVTSYQDNQKSNVVVRDLALDNWSVTRSQWVSGPKSWRCAL